jgi:predicted RNA-binding protein YlqC (UPF0109 family)
MSQDVPELVAYVARALADAPESIAVAEGNRGRQRVVRLTVSDADLGRVIGREGRVANALRVLLKAAPGPDRWGREITD